MLRTNKTHSRYKQSLFNLKKINRLRTCCKLYLNNSIFFIYSLYSQRLDGREMQHLCHVDRLQQPRLIIIQTYFLFDCRSTWKRGRSLHNKQPTIDYNSSSSSRAQRSTKRIRHSKGVERRRCCWNQSK